MLNSLPFAQTMHGDGKVFATPKSYGTDNSSQAICTIETKIYF